MVDGLARVMCMNEVIDEPKPADNRNLDTTSPHRKHKDKKKIKCPELKYNKFQPPPQAVFEYKDGTGSNNIGPAGQSLLQQYQAAGGGGGGPANNTANHNTMGRAQYGMANAMEMQTPKASGVNSQVIESDVREIKRILRTYIQRLNEKDAQGKVAKEWRIVARVLDRLFFFIYVSTIIVSLATIFPKG